MSFTCIQNTRFRVKIILNFLHDNEIIRANLYVYKRILNRRPFMNKVFGSVIPRIRVYGRRFIQNNFSSVDLLVHDFRSIIHNKYVPFFFYQ